MAFFEDPLDIGRGRGYVYLSDREFQGAPPVSFTPKDRKRSPLLQAGNFFVMVSRAQGVQLKAMFLRALLVLFLAATCAGAYSVLSHEAIIDAAWDQSIKPILLKRFPNATADDLLKAHGYAYGGAIIQDLGYYPFGSHLFTDLAHYARSGDFILNLLSEAQDLNEYAFSLGSLAHYCADNEGHPIGVNRSVPMVYPKVRSEFGDTATYEDNPADHLKMEFAFDVLQVANGHYAPQTYHDFIGFQVSKPVLERAFLKTYGIEMKDVFLSVDLALGTYRHSVGTIIPEMTKVAWDQKKDDLIKSTPGLTRRRFVYNLSRSSYEKEWGHEYERPGIGARILAFFLRLIPRVGPFKALSFKPPTPEADKLFMESFNKALVDYRALLARVRAGSTLELPNTNFDLGKPSRFGDYRMADEAYAKLLDKLKDKKFATVDDALRANIVHFLDHPKLEPKTAAALAELKAAVLTTGGPDAKKAGDTETAAPRDSKRNSQ